MCDSPIMAYVAKNPKRIFGNFMILTRQYRELVQLNKEYLIFPSEHNSRYLSRFENVQTVWLPCGKCIQCVNQRSKSWEIRSLLENREYKESCCLTLTYNDENLTTIKSDSIDLTDKDGVINYKDVQDFVKRLRKHFKFKREIRYICSCEYGSTGTLRPHYHIIIFNYCPNDLRLYKRSKKGTCLYKSDFLTRLWSKGFVDVGKVDIQACRYISQYCCKGLLKERKCISLRDKEILKYKNSVNRECLHASIGLGLKGFVKKYHTFIDSNKIQYGKFTYAIPRYFIKKLEVICPRLYRIVKQKGHDFWLNFKNTIDDQRRAKLRTEHLLSKLNLFHSDTFNLLAT